MGKKFLNVLFDILSWIVIYAIFFIVLCILFLDWKIGGHSLRTNQYNEWPTFFSWLKNYTFFK